MKTLIVGASGATGKHVVNHLLQHNKDVKIIVRSKNTLPKNWIENNKLEIIVASILDLDITQIQHIISDCDSVVSCLGHNLTFKGLFGHPRRLVTDTVTLITQAILKEKKAVAMKYILMNTSGNQNHDLSESRSFGEKLVVFLIRHLLPPHKDNEKAADYLRVNIKQDNPFIEWIAVRPDSLIDESSVSAYSIYPSPIRSAIFNPGKTSRINVAHFMSELIVDTTLWKKWKGQMPVIYNTDSLN